MSRSPELDESRQTPAPATMISRVTGVLLGGLGVVLALIAVDVLAINGIQPAQARPTAQVVKVSGAPVVQPTLYLTVSAAIKPGPDGKLHDAFSVTSFSVHAGQPVKLVIDNTDSAAHSIVAPDAGVNIIVAPGTHTYTLLVRTAGRFQWLCMKPCDPYSMAHNGYMRGYITAT